MGPVETGEPITRYLLQKSHFSKESKSVKAAAFVPPNDNPKTSVFRILELSEDQIWQIGIDEVESRRDRSLKARGDIVVEEILYNGLNVIPETSQHERHADIGDWPREQHKILEIASALALKSTLFIKP